MNGKKGGGEEGDRKENNGGGWLRDWSAEKGNP